MEQISKPLLLLLTICATISVTVGCVGRGPQFSFDRQTEGEGTTSGEIPSGTPGTPGTPRTTEGEFIKVPYVAMGGSIEFSQSDRFKAYTTTSLSAHKPMKGDLYSMESVAMGLGQKNREALR